MRLIDEHKAEEKFQLNAVYTGREILDKLRTCATVNAVPVVHGEWKLLHIGHGHLWKCSVCNKTEIRASDYCPNCGAKMDGGSE